ncbi:methyltransferase domain-containing protein [Planctomyces sp. SH-PL62]|uniref:methyltransferase domain-containing protein n=1 Tax=Planctomyces sp. SH-PL62 TaxID=1636152 RepID=UPI00078D1D12|nr:methyltransferase domain-containing protein [Planctomyces sp. SH-PL62]AMV40388.1 Phthiotriol/phenolphthiotriol dimycocerosates methyltransferase [Planctomyces sp. SH-PL62]
MTEPALNPDLIALLRSPRTRSSLHVEGSELASPDGSERYPIVGGVPRLAGESYVGSFGRQWNRYDVARTEEDEATFEAKTGVAPREMAGKRVLDAGCGGGRYAKLLGDHGAEVLGVDLSSAVDKAAALCAGLPGVQIVQADLLDLPVVEEAFDLVFSIGVLHHSPDPRRAFAEIARRVRPGGRLAVWLYRRNTPPQEWLNTGVRALTTRLPARVLEPLCAGLGALGSVPVLNRTLNKLVNFSAHPDWTLRVCDNFDWWAPEHQSHHTLPELSSWFVEEGFENLVELRPMKSGRLYGWAYDRDLIIGSGVNVAGRKRLRP